MNLKLQVQMILLSISIKTKKDLNLPMFPPLKDQSGIAGYMVGKVGLRKTPISCPSAQEAICQKNSPFMSNYISGS